jgi:hypothetical protein
MCFPIFGQKAKVKNAHLHSEFMNRFVRKQLEAVSAQGAFGDAQGSRVSKGTKNKVYK